MYQVIVDRERPDFRVFLDLLYGSERNMDTEGDSYIAYSRVWTELYMKDRESDDPCVDIFQSDKEQNIFVVTSKSHKLESLTALYLYLYCGVSMQFNGRQLEQQDIEELKRQYDAELLRAENSVWHQSSQNNPFPNLR